MEKFRQIVRSYTREIYEIPISKVLIKLGLTPNMITFIGLVITIFGSYFIYQGEFLIGGIIVAFGTILDSIDGAMARLTKNESVFGDLLDSVIDRYGEATIFVAMKFFQSLPAGVQGLAGSLPLLSRPVSIMAPPVSLGCIWIA